MTAGWSIGADRAALAVTETGAQLSQVRFTLADGRTVAPMHTAPWADEALPADTPPVLRMLRGDFFCAPFGDSDVLADETRGHGRPANGTWRVTGQTATALDIALDGDVMGAAVTARIEVRPGHSVVYQRHVLTGGAGRLPLGHHAMLRAEPPLLLGFSPWRWAGAPEAPVEVPPAGRSLLAYPQVISDPRQARRADGGRVDLMRYPVAEGHEDIWMLVAAADQPFAWSAATASGAGWVWFALKDPRLLPATTLWLSDGGRSYAPWLSRHRRVIGIEDVAGYFHLGHAASTGDNPLARQGIATAATLRPETPLAIPYLFGVAAVPADFGAVATIRPAPGGVTLADAAGHSGFAALDLSHITHASDRDPP